MKKSSCIALSFMCVISALSGCALPYQISALRSYNGPTATPTDKCLVVRTSLQPTFMSTVDENKAYILGDSHVETNGSYENEEAAYDCMSIGAKSVLVLDRGVISSSTNYVPGITTYNYYGATNTMTSYNYGYYVTSNTSAYVVVFFANRIPAFGTEITVEMYDKWKSRNAIYGCDGCQK